MIGAFKGRYRFLSNFYPAVVTGPNKLVCPTVEHAFQAWKSVDDKVQRSIVAAASPSIAKQRGRKAKLRGDWDEMRLAVMKHLLDQKFAAGSELGDALLGTTGEELVEGNDWGDNYWGDAGAGENWLGRLLMVRRSELYYLL